MKLTPTTIRSLTYTDKTKDYYDESSPLVLRVGAKSKSFWCRYQVAGKRRRYVLGQWPEMTLADARIAARDAINDAKKGNDPALGRKEYKAGPTVNDLWAEYQKKLAARRKPKAPATMRQELGYWERVIQPAIGDMKVTDVKPVHLAQLLNDYATKNPVAANRCHALLSIMWKPAMEFGWCDVHPLQWISKPGGQELPKDRHLSHEEIAIVWNAAGNLRRNPRDQIRLGLLTCARPGEIANMRWSDIDGDLWHVNNTKTGVALVLPLPTQAMAILEPRRNNPCRRYVKAPSPFVFPSAHNRSESDIGPAEPPIKQCKKIAAEAGLKPFTPHDLRRTGRTLLSSLQTPHHVRQRILGHSLGKVEQAYDKFDYLPEKRTALQSLGDMTESILTS